MSQSNDIHPDQISADLAALIHTVSRASDNREIRNACIQLLTAANELLPLRDEKVVKKVDMRYLQSALDWGNRGMSTLSDLTVKVHEGSE